MEAPAQYYFHRTQKCFYLRKELNNDIDLLMDGKFNHLLYSALTDVSDKDYDITDLCNEMISKGMLKRTYSGEPVIAISVALKRRIADELALILLNCKKLCLCTLISIQRPALTTFFLIVKECIIKWWIKMSEWKYNLRWRTNFEGLELLGWTAGIAATIGVNTLFNMPSLPCYLSVAVQAAYGIRSLPAAWISTHISVDSNANLNRSSWT